MQKIEAYEWNGRVFRFKEDALEAKRRDRLMSAAEKMHTLLWESGRFHKITPFDVLRFMEALSQLSPDGFNKICKDLGLQHGGV